MVSRLAEKNHNPDNLVKVTQTRQKCGVKAVYRLDDTTKREHTEDKLFNRP